jgi:stage V sporulation protein G
MFVAMPSRRDEAGMFRDIIHPINPEARSQLEGSILKAYDDYMGVQ